MNDGVVTLLDGDGEEIEIPLDKLSKADQTYVKGQSANPFRPANKSPFMPKKGAEKQPAGKASSSRKSDQPEVVQVNRKRSKEIKFINDVGWSYVPPTIDPPAAKLKAASLPERPDIFDKLKSVAPNLAAQKVAFSMIWSRPAKDETTRIFLADLQTGDVTDPDPIPGAYAPIALHDDGERVVLRHEKFGLSEKAKMFSARFVGDHVEVEKAALAYEGSGLTDIDWASFCNDDMFVTCSKGGVIVGWDFETLQPKFHLQAAPQSTPALSPDHAVLAFYVDKRVILLDIARKAAIGMIEVPQEVPVAEIAFSPSGSRIVCAGRENAFVWDATTGELQRQLPLGQMNASGNVCFPDEEFLLLGKSILLNIENEIPVWQYTGTESAWSEQGITVLAGSSSPQSGGIFPVKLPHPEAAKLLKEVVDKPALLAFRVGDPVKIDVSGVPGDKQNEVRESITKHLKAIDSAVSDAATVTIFASVTGPTSRTLRFFNAGDVQAQEYLSKMEMQFEGTRVWGANGTNVPGIVTYNQREGLDAKLKEISKGPNIAFFGSAKIPKYVLKPTKGSNTTGNTLGSSTIDRR